MKCKTNSARALVVSAGLLAVGQATAHAQSAQDAQAAVSGAVNEIVVTAQRREQSIQDVPIAVTAFGDEALDARQVDNAADLQLVVPNFSYTSTNFGGVNYTIRGIGASVLGDGADTGVALHYNGAFLQGGGNSSLYYDVEAVEVLRGPQGTLFGRNATGGAVNLRTRKPRPTLEGSVEGRVGNFDTRGVEAMLNVPVTRSLAVRAALVTEQYDGDIDNLTTGNRINGADVFSARGSVRWTPSNLTTVDLTATFLRADGDGMQAERRECRRDPIGNLGCLPSGLGPGLPNYTSTLAGLVATGIGLVEEGEDPFIGSIAPRGDAVALDFDPEVYTKEWIATLEIEHKFGPMTFNALTAWATQNGHYVTDPDFAVALGRFAPVFPGGVVPTSRPDPDNLGSLAGRISGSFDRPWSLERGSGKSRQWLQEVRLASNFDGPFDFLVGAFYRDYDRQEDFFQIASSLDAAGLILEAAPPFFRLETPVADLKSYAVFGEAYVDVTDTVRLTGGLRWTRDKKRQVNRNLLFNLPQPFDSNRLTKEAVTGRAVVEWRPAAASSLDLLTYASYSRGYKGGGFNPQGTVAVSKTFEPEYVNSVEVGAKSVLFDAVTANFAAFRYDYDGLQVSKIVNRSSINENIDATIVGAEFELGARIGDSLSVDVSAGHLATEIGNATSIDPRDPTGGRRGFIAVKDTTSGGNCVATTAQLFRLLDGVPFGDCAALGLSSGNAVSLKGRELPNAPEWTLRFGAEYARGIAGDLQFSVRADYSWRSDFWGRIYNRDPIDRIESWGILDARVQVERADKRWFARVEGSNLLDEDAVTGMYVADASAGLATNLFVAPRRRVTLVVGGRF